MFPLRTYQVRIPSQKPLYLHQAWVTKNPSIKNQTAVQGQHHEKKVVSLQCRKVEIFMQDRMVLAVRNATRIQKPKIHCGSTPAQSCTVQGVRSVLHTVNLRRSCHKKFREEGQASSREEQPLLLPRHHVCQEGLRVHLHCMKMESKGNHQSLACFCNNISTNTRPCYISGLKCTTQGHS